jgi:hypothetical protein
MPEFVQHFVSGNVVYVIQLNEGDEYFLGIEIGSKNLTPKVLPTSEYDENELPRFSDIALSLNKKDSYAPNRARDKYYQTIATAIENLRQPINW